MILPGSLSQQCIKAFLFILYYNQSMDRTIVRVVTRKSLYQAGSDFSYWQQQPYEARIAALEEIRTEYQTWFDSHHEDLSNVQPGFQRVYRIIKR
jgi:hypothetical protein